MQYTISILIENQAGVLSKISGLFSRRGFNIDSLAVGVTIALPYSKLPSSVMNSPAPVALKSSTASP